MPPLFALLSIGLVLLALVAIGIKYARRFRESSKSTWEGLMSQIIPINRQAIEAVALDAVAPSGERRSDEHRRELGRQEIWNLLGGMEGIRRMEKNSRVLIEMAAYLQRWHPEASETAEELRLEAVKLEWHVGRLREAEKNQCLEVHFHSYGQNAAISYYLMLQRLISLYQHNEASLCGELRRAL